MSRATKIERPKPRTCCKKAASRGDLFCNQCGTPMAELAKPAPPASPIEEAKEPDASPSAESAEPCMPLVGPNKPRATSMCSCGEELKDSANFCPMCGSRIGQPKTQFRLNRVGDAPFGVDLPEHDFSIGKSAECDLAIDDDEFLSRKHAQFTRSDGMLFVEDVNSSNGTFLRVRRPIVVEHGDEIVLGTTVLRVEQVEA